MTKKKHRNNEVERKFPTGSEYTVRVVENVTGTTWTCPVWALDFESALRVAVGLFETDEESFYE